MKSILRKLLVLLVISAIATIGAFAQDFTYGDLMYTINDDDVTVTLNGHVDGYSVSGELNIPSTVYNNGQSYTVTIINGQAFYYCEGLTGQLIIPDTVDEIGEMAFFKCTGFTSLTLSNALTDLGNDVFNYCGFTGTIIIPKHLKHIDATTFFCCNGIEGFVVDPENNVYDSRNNCNAIISTSDNELIIGCKNSTIPNTVISIAEGAFYHVTELTSITIPNSVQSIGGMSFWYTGLTSINIPNSVNLIVENPFAGCAELATITVESGNTTFDSRNNCNAIIRTNYNELIAGCQNTVIPNSVTIIGGYAFYDCNKLSGKLVLPEDITTIAAYAFCKCSSLTGSLTLPNSLVDIGESAFADCSGFDGRLTLSESLITIPNWAFEGCYGFTDSLVIPNSVTSIGARAFKNCYGFNRTLVLSSSLTTINNMAFAGCTGFRDVVSLAETPPTLVAYPFGGLTCTMLTVPCGCIQAYENSMWNDLFTTIVEDCEDITEFKDNTLAIYPNPTKGFVKIEANNIKDISIFNILGEKIFESEVDGDAFEYDFGIHEDGVYFVKTITDNGVITKKVTVD